MKLLFLIPIVVIVYWLVRQMYLVRIVEPGCDIDAVLESLPMGGTLFLEPGIYELGKSIKVEQITIEGRQAVSVRNWRNYK